MNVGKCRDCGASVIWSKTVNGSNVPLNPLPIQVAMRILDSDDEGVVAVRTAHEIHLRTCTKKKHQVAGSDERIGAARRTPR